MQADDEDLSLLMCGDEAFKALEEDPSLLIHPVFKERFLRATVVGDFIFFDRVGSSILKWCDRIRQEEEDSKKVDNEGEG